MVNRMKVKLEKGAERALRPLRLSLGMARGEAQGKNGSSVSPLTIKGDCPFLKGQPLFEVSVDKCKDRPGGPACGDGVFSGSPSASSSFGFAQDDPELIEGSGQAGSRPGKLASPGMTLEQCHFPAPSWVRSKISCSTRNRSRPYLSRASCLMASAIRRSGLIGGIGAKLNGRDAWLSISILEL